MFLQPAAGHVAVAVDIVPATIQRNLQRQRGQVSAAGQVKADPAVPVPGLGDVQQRPVRRAGRPRIRVEGLVVCVFHPHIERLTQEIPQFHAAHVAGGLGVLPQRLHALLIQAQEGVGLYPVALVPDVVAVIQAVNVYKKVLRGCFSAQDFDGVVVHLFTKAIQLIAAGGNHGDQGLRQRPRAVVKGFINFVIFVLVYLVHRAEYGPKAVIQAGLAAQGLNGAASTGHLDDALIVLYLEKLAQVRVDLDKLGHFFPGQTCLALLCRHREQLAVVIA